MLVEVHLQTEGWQVETVPVPLDAIRDCPLPINSHTQLLPAMEHAIMQDGVLVYAPGLGKAGDRRDLAKPSNALTRQRQPSLNGFQCTARVGVKHNFGFR